MNRHEHGELSHSALLESEIVSGRSTMFGRLELLQKSAHDLAIAALPVGQVFAVGSASAGFIRDLSGLGGAAVGLGVRGSVNVIPRILEAHYGTRTPLGCMIFLRARFRGQ